MRTTFTMVRDAECKHSWRYKPVDPDDKGTNTFYLLKDACNGEVPNTILITVTALD